MNMENVITWKTISGLDKAKRALEEAVILPIKFPQVFEGCRQPLKGILLYGPPGSGKTLISKSVAAESAGSFFSVTVSDLIQRQIKNESLITEVFKIAKLQKPSLIFIDDFDFLYQDNGELFMQASLFVIDELLQQIRLVEPGVIVMAATQQPWLLDANIRRAFEKRIQISLPEESARLQIIENQLTNTKHHINQVQLKDIAQKTEGYSPADLIVLVRDAIYEQVRIVTQINRFKKIIIDGQEKLTPADPNEDIDIIETNYKYIEANKLHLPNTTYNDFLNALTKVKKSISDDELNQYNSWTQDFGQLG